MLGVLEFEQGLARVARGVEIMVWIFGWFMVIVWHLEERKAQGLLTNGRRVVCAAAHGTSAIAGGWCR